MSELKSSDIHLSRKRPLSRGSYGAESEGESTTGSDNGDVGGGNYETKLMKRERNRQTAKLNRDRKKEEAKELQDTVQYLKRKNQELQSELNSQPSYLADEQRLVMSFERHFSSQVTSVLNLLRLRAGSDSGAFYVINAASHFFPIIYASPALVELTGYSLHEIIGQNCGFLSGLQTSRNERERLNLALQQGQDIAATLLNYRRDGSMFWNNLNLANLHSRIDNEEVPHLIVGLHTEVFAKRSLVIDSSSTEKDDRADSGSSNRSQQSGPGSHFTGTNLSNNHSGAPSGAGASCGSASKGGNGASAEGRKQSDVAWNQSSGYFTPTMPVPGAMELRRVSSDDDDHTILQEILTTHQRGLTTSSTSTSNNAAQRPGTHARHSRGKGSLLNIAGRGVRTRAMLEHSAPVLRKSTSANTPVVNASTFPVATGVYHSPVPEPRFAAAAHSPRCNSVMSAITADGTDNEASSASPPANVLHLNAHDMSCIDHAVQRCASTNSLASETAPLSNYFASTSLGNQPKNSAFTSLASLTPKMTPSRALPGPFPGLQGLSNGALRHLGVESFNSPPCKVGEVPLFQHPAAPPRRPNSAASNVSNSSGTSSVHETTSLRRNYYSALQEHFSSENHAGELQVNRQNLRTSASVLGSPLLPASPGSAFTPNVNTPFQVVRRVSLGEETDMLSGRTTHPTGTSSTDGVTQVTSTRNAGFTFTRNAGFTASDHRVRRSAENTTGDSLEQDFDQELASYMDPAHAQRTPLRQRSSTGASAATLPLTSASADDVWASWETGTIVDPLHVNPSRSNTHNLNTVFAMEGPVTPVNMPRAPVGCAPQEVSATGSTSTPVTFRAPALQVRW